MQSWISDLLNFLTMHNILVISATTFLLCILSLILWIWVHRLYLATKELLSKLPVLPRDDATAQGYDRLKHQLDTMVYEIHSQLSEERGRITALQRMFIEMREKYTSTGTFPEDVSCREGQGAYPVYSHGTQRDPASNHPDTPEISKRAQSPDKGCSG